MNKKIIKYSLIINSIYAFYLIYLLYFKPTHESFGNLDEFLNSLILLPIIVFIVTFKFKNFIDRVSFSYSSFIFLYIFLINEIIIRYDIFTLSILLLLLVTPLLIAFVHFLIIDLVVAKIKK